MSEGGTRPAAPEEPDVEPEAGWQELPRDLGAWSALTESQKKVLELPQRWMIYAQIARTPGLNKNQLGEKVGVHAAHLDFHLDRLKEEGLIVTKPAAQDREILCFLAEDEELWEDPNTRILFGRSSIREVGIYVAGHPGTSTTGIAEAVGLTEMTIRHHLRTLLEYGLVRRVKVGRSVEYHPSPDLHGWATELGSLYSVPWEEPPEV